MNKKLIIFIILIFLGNIYSYFYFTEKKVSNLKSDVSLLVDNLCNGLSIKNGELLINTSILKEHIYNVGNTNSAIILDEKKSFISEGFDKEFLLKTIDKNNIAYVIYFGRDGIQMKTKFGYKEILYDNLDNNIIDGYSLVSLLNINEILLNIPLLIKEILINFIFLLIIFLLQFSLIRYFFLKSK